LSQARRGSRRARPWSINSKPAPPRELDLYQNLLAERLWREIQDDPARRLQALAHPHE
jgi:hypothetical protein